MAGLTAQELANWLSLYAAAGICAAFASILAIVAVGIEVVQGRE
jgi:hypothetical protein